VLSACGESLVSAAGGAGAAGAKTRPGTFLLMGGNSTHSAGDAGKELVMEKSRRRQNAASRGDRGGAMMICFKDDGDVQWRNCEKAEVGHCRCNAMLKLGRVGGETMVLGRSEGAPLPLDTPFEETGHPY
jgi:hypothetical protein